MSAADPAGRSVERPQSIPDIHITRIYEGDPECDVHYETFGRLAEIFGRNTPTHRHSRFYQVHLLVRGSISLQLDDQAYFAEAPLVFITPPAIPHAFYSEEHDGVTVSSPNDLNGGTIKDIAGNDATLTFTPPNTTGVKINYPSLGMDFTNGTTGRYTLNGTVYNDLSSFLTASSGTFSRNSIATYFDSTGTLRTASNNTPRFDYDPVTHAAKGILIEESRRNISKYSEQLDNNSTWLYGAGSITVTPNTSETTAPDGTNNAEKISVHSTTGVTFAQWGMAVTGTSATYSIYLKQGSSATTGNKFCLRNQTTATNLIYGDLNYATDVFSYGVGTSGVSVQNIGNGWKRLIMTATSGITSGDSLVAYVGFTGNSYSIGEYLYAWGAQVEAGSFATSYIPTTTAAVTRAADVITFD